MNSEGFFLRKTISIKTNNKNIINNLLNELEYFGIGDVYVSCRDFKIYTNIIIHYTRQKTRSVLKKNFSFACIYCNRFL